MSETFPSTNEAPQQDASEHNEEDRRISDPEKAYMMAIEANAAEDKARFYENEAKELFSGESKRAETMRLAGIDPGKVANEMIQVAQNARNEGVQKAEEAGALYDRSTGIVASAGAFEGMGGRAEELAQQAAGLTAEGSQAAETMRSAGADPLAAAEELLAQAHSIATPTSSAER